MVERGPQRHPKRLAFYRLSSMRIDDIAHYSSALLRGGDIVKSCFLKCGRRPHVGVKTRARLDRIAFNDICSLRTGVVNRRFKKTEGD